MLNSLVGIIASSGAPVAGGAYESIASATGTGSSGTITFSSIPATYQHLQIRGICRSTDPTNKYSEFYVTFNGASTNMRSHILYGDSNAAFTSAPSYTTVMQTGWIITNGNTLATNNLSSMIIDVQDYTNTTRNKTLRSIMGYDNNQNTGGIDNHVLALASGFRDSTSAISSIELKTASGSFTTDTTFALYGIKGA